MFKTIKQIITREKIMLLDGIGLLFIGLLQSFNSLIGYSCNLGLYKILNEIKFAALGVFESSVLIFIIGIILVKTAKDSGEVIFWNLIACFTHLMIGISNIIFWQNTFIVNDAESSGIISTSIHFSFCLVQLFFLFRKRSVEIN